ncbi:hypothetical protein UFOVP853_48 [uncultured Caudovirales phage]|uniref:Uncharacterized protein n=1 Tax=uncultured Caudovirales phage TaxID=2100421 RepID=A0A6J5P5A2_9CAUD|nr:hypothetical protein UFOVP853_48 [uncultured Caudovirales phage]
MHISAPIPASLPVVTAGRASHMEDAAVAAFEAGYRGLHIRRLIVQARQAQVEANDVSLHRARATGNADMIALQMRLRPYLRHRLAGAYRSATRIYVGA